MNLNLCAGGEKREGHVNIDKNPKTNPDLLLDITKELLPYEDSTIEEVRFMHGPEHIERNCWDFVFMEILRVLVPTGRLVLGYPEFAVCAMEYIKSHQNNDTKHEYFLQTLYGRRYWTGDEHVTAVNSPELQRILESCGYFRVKFAPESTEDFYNSLMVAFKDPQPQCREILIGESMGLKNGESIQDIQSVHHVGVKR